MLLYQMKPANNIRVISCLFFLLCFSMHIFSQKDNRQNSNDTKQSNFFIDAQKNIIPINFALIDTSQGTSILNFNPQEKLIGFKSNVNNYFDPFNLSVKKSANFMSHSSKDDSDILVKKHFNGKDMSNPKLKSDFSLGTFHTKSKSVRIEVRDHSLVDGDRIKVYLNERVINSNIMLNGISYAINIELISGYNRIDIEALNQGYSGPNTAELRVFDEKGYLISSQEWNIATGNFATLGIIKN